ncbi:ribosomal protein [Paenibacillus jamilae]|uniref:Ribosomal protein n=1 Tax=Paenibacillus jamilae TaxID=114136 RepID=A0ACC4ZQM6_9BACL|nr:MULTISPECIES: ribosomal-processing cysteine protease Prp [Paenibacillus]AJE52785.1 ribosomal protein [Paenibacillus polymyxa]AUO07593.1 ribosomal-processing cysteine protease Prp [Paenibacillus sp. lzh-N1]AZH30811.1 ribosomal-processing cysteine protease Prp [Paenibacillus sp. M-152]KTS80317.1 ribosomal protein [Paenibacillus jamilae]QOH63382.1 ribosomal-processing cysteine protease Prp [Paenibacillus polymyxa]
MIIVRIIRLEDGSIQGFSVKGHANFAKSGEDIVCAGVSAVTVGTVNSIVALTDVEMETEMENGFLSAYLSPESYHDTNAQVQLLLESMVIMLTSIAESYGKYIQIENKQRRR